MALYDEIGGSYDVTRRPEPYIVSRLLHHLMPRAGALFLDLGCGTGNYTASLANAGVRIFGYDASTTMINRARSKSGAVQWLGGNAESLPFADGSFGGTVST